MIIKYKIIHLTEYKFQTPVFFEPQYLRFRPKTTPFSELESFNLTVVPDPVGISDQTDAENNIIHFCWFEGLNNNFTIRSESVVNIKEYNPLNFILHPSSYLNLPIDYSESLKLLLKPALIFDTISNSLIEYGESIINESEFSTITFLTNLTKQIHNDFIIESREEGLPFEANKTFEIRKGSCRDLVWMEIQLLRYLGFATRFVSGYYYFPMEVPDFELHAWLEVFLPGAGWLGLDPSHGIVAGNSHIQIASSSHYENTMPVTGTFRGDASSKLTTKISIEVI